MAHTFFTDHFARLVLKLEPTFVHTPHGYRLQCISIFGHILKVVANYSPTHCTPLAVGGREGVCRVSSGFLLIKSRNHVWHAGPSLNGCYNWACQQPLEAPVALSAPNPLSASSTSLVAKVASMDCSRTGGPGLESCLCKTHN